MTKHQQIHARLNAARNWRQNLNQYRKGSRLYVVILESIKRQHRMIELIKKM